MKNKAFFANIEDLFRSALLPKYLSRWQIIRPLPFMGNSIDRTAKEFRAILMFFHVLDASLKEAIKRFLQWKPSRNGAGRILELMAVLSICA